MQQPPPLTIRLEQSLLLIALVGLAHGAGLIGLLSADLPATVRWVGTTLLLLSCALQGSRLRRRHPDRIVRLTLHPHHTELTTYGGQRRLATLEPGTRITPWCIALSLRPFESPWWRARYPLLLLPDALTATDWRRLRIGLQQGHGRHRTADDRDQHGVERTGQ